MRAFVLMLIKLFVVVCYYSCCCCCCCCDCLCPSQPPEGGGGVFGALKVLSEPRAQSLSRLGARTKMLFLAKWSSGVKQWNPTAPNFPSWSPRVLHFLGRSPGAVIPFGTLLSEN